MGKKWSTVSISGYKADSPSDDGAATEGNRVKYSTIYTDLTDPIKTGVDSIVSGLDELFTEATTPVASAYTTVATDHATWLEVTGTTTITLLAASTAGAGYRVGVKNAGTGIVTVARSGADTIDGATSKSLAPTDSALFVVNGAGDGYLKLMQDVGDTLFTDTFFRVELSGDQTTTDEVVTKIQWDTEIQDYGNNFATYGYTVPADGVYHFIMSGRSSSTLPSGSYVQSLIYADPGGVGAPVVRASGQYARTGANSFSVGIVSCYLELDADDIVYGYWIWDSPSGGTSGIDSPGSVSFFAGGRVA